jgi:hypothetical protein
MFKLLMDKYIYIFIESGFSMAITRNTFNIGSIDLINYKDDVVSLNEVFESFTYSESIFGMGTTGKISISDQIGLLESLPIIGEERIEIYINNDNITYNKLFNVVKVDNLRTHENNAKLRLYDLILISPHSEFNITNKISSSYSNLSSDKVIKDIFITHLNEDIETEPSISKLNICSPYWKPFRLIQMISNMSIAKSNASNYILFENNKGWHWKTINSLAEQIPVITFNYELNQSNKDREEVSINPIKGLKINNLYDTINGSLDGLYGSNMVSYSLINRKVEELSSNRNWDELNKLKITGKMKRGYSRGSFDDFPNMNHMSQSDSLPGGNDYFKSFSNPMANRFFYNNEPDSLQFTDKPNNVLLYNNSMASLNQFIMTCEIEANINITCGDMIKINIPSMADIYTKDKFNSGVFMISNIKQIFNSNVLKTEITLLSDSMNINLNKKEPLKKSSISSSAGARG